MLNNFKAANIHLISVWTTIENWDRSMFELFNTKLTNNLFDKVAPVIREPSTWYPLYIALLIYIIIKLKKQSWKWILAFIFSVAISDTISSHILKEWVGRVRPCSEPLLIGHCRSLLGWCPSSGSFTSSHASNHFAMGVFMYYTLYRFFGNFSIVFIVWAATISYCQVYVGVHYPLDVICGALLGITIGKLMSRGYQKFGRDALHGF